MDMQLVESRITPYEYWQKYVHIGDRHLPGVREAGLSSVFLQFDGVEDAVFKRLRGRALFADKCRAIDNLAAVGLGVVLVPTVQGCCIHVAQPDGGLVPFCSFNLTSRDGRALHRPTRRHHGSEGGRNV